MKHLNLYVYKAGGMLKHSNDNSEVSESSVLRWLGDQAAAAPMASSHDMEDLQQIQYMSTSE